MPSLLGRELTDRTQVTEPPERVYGARLFMQHAFLVAVPVEAPQFCEVLHVTISSGSAGSVEGENV